MPKLKRYWQKRKNSYKELVEIRKKKNKTKYEKDSNIVNLLRDINIWVF